MFVPVANVFHLSPGNRNIELALTFWSVTSIVTVIDRGDRRVLHLTAAVFILGAVYATDPYFVPMVSLSLALWAAYLWAFGHGWRKSLIALAAIIGSLSVYEVLMRVLERLDIHDAVARTFTLLTWDRLPEAMSKTFGAFLEFFGGDFAGASLPPYKPVLIAALNAAVLVLFITLIWQQRRRFGPVQVYWAILFPVVPAVYLLTSGDLARYMVFAVCACVALLFTVDLHLAGALRRVFILALAVTIAASGYQFVILGKDAVATSWANRLQGQEYMDVASVVRNNGLTKGYAQYWMATVMTHLTDHYSLTIPMVCSAGDQAVFYWGMDAAWTAKPANRTFVIVGKRDQAGGHVCDDANLIHQFGAPDSILPVNDSTNVWVWNYDVTSRIPNATTPAAFA